MNDYSAKMAFAATLFFLPTLSVRSPARFLRRPSNPCLFLNLPKNGADSTGNSRQIKRPVVANASPASGGVKAEEEDGVSLGTMKLPMDTDLARFETLLFQVNCANCDMQMLE